MGIDKLIPLILTEQFNRIGEEYTKEKTLANDWYLQYSWTEEDQTAFIDWLTDFLRKKLKVTRKCAIREAQMWNLNYGWKIKETV